MTSRRWLHRLSRHRDAVIACALLVLAVVSVLLVRSLKSSGDCGLLGSVDQFVPNSVSYASCVPAYVVSDSSRRLVTFYGAVPSPNGTFTSIRWSDRQHLFISGDGRAFVLDGTEYFPDRESASGARVLIICPTTVQSGELWIGNPPRASATAAAAACRSEANDRT